MPHRRQRGEGRVSFVITLAVFVIGIFLAVKIIPVRIQGYEFNETLREEARYASVHNEDGKIRERILEKAAALDVPLKAANLAIHRTKTRVVISARYEKPVDLKLTTYTYRFDREQSAPLF